MHPYFEVLPRKYRFRILNACMSRFFKLALSWNGNAGAVHSSSPTTATSSSIRSQLTELDEQGIAERYDIVVDFSQFQAGRQALSGQPAEADGRAQAGQGR